MGVKKGRKEKTQKRKMGYRIMLNGVLFFCWEEF